MAKLPTSTDVSFSVSDSIPAKSETMILCVAEGQSEIEADLPDGCADALKRLAGGGAFKGKPREVAVDLVSTDDGKFQRLVLIGLGKPAKLDAESVRDAGGAAARAVKKAGGGAVAVVPPSVASLSAEAVAEAFVTGYALAAFDFREYQGTVKKAEDAPKPAAVTLVGAKSLKAAVDRAATMAEGQNFARTIANRPGNDLNPPSLAKVAEELAKAVGLTCRVMDEKELKKLGMGGILAVGAGSNAPPRLIVLEHDPAGKARAKKGTSKSKTSALKSPLLVVGKAITFDTGGISIKSAANMGRMIFDKSGGMAVLGLMCAVATLKLKVPVVGLLSSAENMPGQNAYRPGDILTMYNGVTVEVTNTDAEGRLVLADALAWGIETYKPRACVNLATLTGACVVALGETTAGAWCNDDSLFGALESASKSAGEKLWRMPLGEEFREKLKADAADIVNSAGRWGGACTAAEFLHHFVTGGKAEDAESDPTPWCHLDIAGPADTEVERPYYAKGGTAFGVRTLVEWAAGQAS